ncbi:hypothetical protein CEXT_679121 [Caerostris extrusa]|uniref:Uncharacterized protein n=1 Tax=Caerostris extrusa TaxID=172846 RepID=A0AAV4SMJ5_CAEEX|nr:hypothetical protein CEXT_679121 [Caerostris extrusa]
MNHSTDSLAKSSQMRKPTGCFHSLSSSVSFGELLVFECRLISVLSVEHPLIKSLDNHLHVISSTNSARDWFLLVGVKLPPEDISRFISRGSLEGFAKAAI